MADATNKLPVRQRPGWLLAKVYPLAADAPQGWFDELLNSGDPVEMIVDLLLTAGEEQLGSLLPPLGELSGQAPTFELPTRARNCLRRQGCTTWEQVCRLTPAEIRAAKNAGDQTVRSVVAWCIRHAGLRARWVSAACPTCGRDDTAQESSACPTCGRDDTAQESSACPTCGRDDTAQGSATSAGMKPNTPTAPRPDCAGASPGVAEPIRLLARWLEVVGERAPAGRDLVNLLSTPAEGLPAEVAQAAAQLLNHPLTPNGADLLDTATSIEAAQRVVGNERAWEIFWERNCAHAHRRPTLTDLGDRVGLTRERVRQLERQTTERLREAIDKGADFEAVRWKAHQLRCALRAGVPLSCLAAEEIIATESAELALALWWAGPYLCRDGWLVREGADPDRTVRAGLRSLPGPEIDLERVAEILDEAEVPRDAMAEILEQSDAARAIGAGLWVRWHGAIADKAEVVLSLLCRPASPEEIVSHFVGDQSHRSVKNALASDGRFYKTNKTDWALSCWGLEEYSGIAVEIVERVERDGGSTEAAALIEELVSTFEVSENSVRNYMATPAIVAEEGQIRLSQPDEMPAPTKELRLSKGVFRPAVDKVVTSFRVDQDVLRGSGQSIDTGLATQLGLKPGDRVSFASAHQELSVSWRAWSTTGPGIGTLRPAAKSLGAEIGSVLVVGFDLGSGTAEIGVVDDALNGDERLRALTGISANNDPAEMLAAAIGVTRSELRASLRRRGDGHLIRLLPNQQDAQLSGQINELAAFLEDL